MNRKETRSIGFQSADLFSRSVASCFGRVRDVVEREVLILIEHGSGAFDRIEYKHMAVLSKAMAIYIYAYFSLNILGKPSIFLLLFSAYILYPECLEKYFTRLGRQQRPPTLLPCFAFRSLFTFEGKKYKRKRNCV